MNEATNSSGAGRWVLALGVGAVTVALASGCGIRPTAIPVDAGRPAVRTACPSPVHPPSVPTSQPSATPKSPVHPSLLPSPVVSPATGSLFSALPSAPPSPNGPVRCP
ncbi:hypothetical protein ACFZB9_11805 [Kitasatospora sp. NPDC008050]|uniref:hypothetical protein n=1 Tax=Kitasatospora sp. NPDC008050 TaxID=3364021 RepID=UPI0036F16838